MDQQIGNIHGFAAANEGAVQAADREVHTGGITGASAGNFTITLPEGTTGNIAYNANLGTIQTAVAAVAPTTDVVVSGTMAALVFTYPQYSRYRELPVINEGTLADETITQFARTTVGTLEPTELSPTNLSGTAVARTGFSDSDMLTVTSMRSRLATIDGTLYTSAYLDTLSYNDMVYAIRVSDHPETIMQ